MCFLRTSLFIILFFLFPLFGGSGLFAQYSISGKIVGLSNSKCYLGHYFASQDNIIYKDTAQINADGVFQFSKYQSLPKGLYVILLPNKSKIELVITANQKFSFTTNYSNLIGAMQVMDSPENQQLYQYFLFLGQQYQALQIASAEQKAQIQTLISGYKNAFFATYPTSFTTKLLKAAEEVVVPPAPLLANGKPDADYAYRYYKTHYFDDFDLSDERLLRTGLFESKIKNYIEKLTYQVEDSLIKSIDLMMKLAGNTAPNRKFIASKMIALYENSNTIGVDGAFVHTVEKYYEGEPNLWNTDALKQVVKRAKTLKPLLINRVIPNLQVSDLKGQMIDLHSLQAKYTVLYFYSLNCKHCQEHAPKMADFQRKMAQKGVKVFAVAVERNEAQWRNFIKTYHTENLINGIDLKNQIDFINQYNTIEFPTVFVLDESKKIIGKRINPAMLEKFIEYYEKR